MITFAQRLERTELMDDMTRPTAEFAAAYKELAVINKRLGGIRAIERFLPASSGMLILDVAAGACDIGDALVRRSPHRVVGLDLNAQGLKLAARSTPVQGDALQLPFRNDTFDVVMASLFFHHLSDEDCVRVLRDMWRVARRLVLVNDLHRHPAAYHSIRILSALFSKSAMVRHDGPVSVQRAFKPEDLLRIAREANIAATVHRSFPYRLVMVAEK